MLMRSCLFHADCTTHVTSVVNGHCWKRSLRYLTHIKIHLSPPTSVLLIHAYLSAHSTERQRVPPMFISTQLLCHACIFSSIVPSQYAGKIVLGHAPWSFLTIYSQFSLLADVQSVLEDLSPQLYQSRVTLASFNRVSLIGFKNSC